MFDLVCKLFIKDYKNTGDSSVREKYGTVISIFSIVCNTIMVIFKLIVSIITNSVSIRADAFNNLSDVGSNLASLFGFRLSNKHPDSNHPYGYGKMEYISGMIVSFLILLVGFEAITDALDKIIHPIIMEYSSVAIIVLFVSILIKLVMWYMNNKAGKAIESETLMAAGQDSFNDSITTFATLICLLFYKFTNINIDAYVGFIVSILVIKSGAEIFKGVMDTILGKPPEKQLIKDIEKLVMSHDYILGIHDLMMHDYGPSKQYLSLHCEVDASVNVIELHDVIDNIEMDIMREFNILTTIHMDPIDTKDELQNTLKPVVLDLVRQINNEYNIHDFRVVRGTTHTNLVFDVLIPSEDHIEHEVLIKMIQDKVHEYNKTYNCVINIDHSFV